MDREELEEEYFRNSISIHFKDDGIDKDKLIDRNKELVTELGEETIKNLSKNIKNRLYSIEHEPKLTIEYRHNLDFIQYMRFDKIHDLAVKRMIARNLEIKEILGSNTIENIENDFYTDLVKNTPTKFS